MVFYNISHRFKRWARKDKAQGTALSGLYEQHPFSRTQLFCDTRFLVVDCEMSGLDPKKCDLLSIGWVLIENGRIVNASAKHLLIHTDKGAGDSIKIHGLHDSNIAGAKSVAAVLMLLMKQMQDCIVVFHHAPIDIRFIQKATLEVFRCPLFFTSLDTMVLEKRRMQLQGKHHSLRLSECRKRYGLAPVNQHNALADARATAELLLAQMAYTGDVGTLKLGHLPLAAV